MYSRTPPDLRTPPPRWTDRWLDYSAPFGPLFALGLYYHFDLAHLPFADQWAPLLRILALIGAALAAVTFLWARNSGFSVAAGLRWSLFVFLFGLPGLLTFRLATDWPIRLRCPSCRRKRAIDRDFCEHCHHPWSLPEPTGTEILSALHS